MDLSGCGRYDQAPSQSTAQWQAREELGAPVGTAVTIFHGVLVRGEQVRPPLHEQVVFRDLVRPFESPVVEPKAKSCAQQKKTRLSDLNVTRLVNSMRRMV